MLGVARESNQILLKDNLDLDLDLVNVAKYFQVQISKRGLSEVVVLLMSYIVRRNVIRTKRKYCKFLENRCMVMKMPQNT